MFDSLNIFWIWFKDWCKDKSSKWLHFLKNCQWRDSNTGLYRVGSDRSANFATIDSVLLLCCNSTSLNALVSSWIRTWIADYLNLSISPGLLIVSFLTFSNRHQITADYRQKTVHLVSGAWIRTHDLLNTSLLL